MNAYDGRKENELPMSAPLTAPLALGDAHDLAPLLAAYVQEMKRGAPRRPDDYYAEKLLQDKTAEIIGVRLGKKLVGFAIFFDLPHPMTGMRAGQLEDFFVIQDSRGKGASHALIDALVAEGRRRGWLELRWMVPRGAPERHKFAEEMAEPDFASTFVIPIRPVETE